MDNPQAFPGSESVGHRGAIIFSKGMTLRDYFAIHCTKEDYIDYKIKNESGEVYTTYQKQPSIQQARYMFADAMLKEREKYDKG